MKLILFLAFILISCQSQIDWKSSLQKDLNAITNLELNSRYTNKGIIKTPLNTWISLLSYKENNIKRCLFYKTPFKDKLGVLKITSVRKGKCDPFAKELIYTKSLEELSINYLSGDHVENSNILELVFLMGSERKKLEIPLLNYEVPKKYKRYDNQLNSSFVDDVAFGDFLVKKTLKDGQLCHGVNSSCQDVVANNCDLCENGAVEVVDFNCPQGGSKYCGQNNCGKKNEPACPRGYKVLGSKLASLCFDGSPAGFCEPGLKTYCNKKNILVCL